ncbi:MAG: DUF5682 family protein [Cyanobacteriota bacterium]|nr:DUF5682 family protein [Cyanobacteriota bacterium]
MDNFACTDYRFDQNILDLNGSVIFFPVRHHSPTAARLLQHLLREKRPQAILIEGPCDFNEQLSELLLPHQLPIAIYSYTTMEDGGRRGAFYPFCLYSPEWQALQIGHELGSHLQFIDLSWQTLSTIAQVSQRYADGQLRESPYIRRLCQQLGVETFDDLWDTLFEIDPALSLLDYLERCHLLCWHIRLTSEVVSLEDRQREAFMLRQIQAVSQTGVDSIVVVTGGFHSYALYTAWQGSPFPSPATPNEGFSEDQGIDQAVGSPEPLLGGEEDDLLTRYSSPRSGIALTPYSYNRLDSLTGYEAGMPGPGFYHMVWESRQAGQGEIHPPLLAQVTQALRRQKQPVSAADWIAVETTAKALALLRGHAQVWRQDLLDGILSALVKDEVTYHIPHPFLLATQEVLRGSERGKLALGTSLPPLVVHLQQLLNEWDLEPSLSRRSLDLDLTQASDLTRSRLLYQLKTLGIPGFSRQGGTDWIERGELLRLWERWQIIWTPNFEAGCIEAAIYGSTLLEAAQASLLEKVASLEGNAEQGSLLLLESCLMGFSQLCPTFQVELGVSLLNIIRQDQEFGRVTKGLGHLLYLYCYDEVLGAAGHLPIALVLAETWERSLWLLESLGQVTEPQPILVGLKTLLETWERCASLAHLDRDYFVQVLERVGHHPGQLPMLRGAAVGSLWVLGVTVPEFVRAQLQSFAQPEHLGDFLTGLFALARELVQRHPDLVVSIDQVMVGFSASEFLEALPALRLAFTYFTPREKVHLIQTLLKATAPPDQPPLSLADLPPLDVDATTAAEVMAFETRLFAAAERYGIRHY